MAEIRACPNCGETVVPPKLKWCSAKCRVAANARLEHMGDERRQKLERMAAMWKSGSSQREIARELDITTASVQNEFRHMRNAGWDLPKRSHADRKRGWLPRGEKDAVEFMRQAAKKRVRGLTSRAVRDGSLSKPDACEECGDGDRIEAHHDDYTKPLEVRWLCWSCHRQAHGQLIEEVVA